MTDPATLLEQAAGLDLPREHVEQGGGLRRVHAAAVAAQERRQLLPGRAAAQRTVDDRQLIPRHFPGMTMATTTTLLEQRMRVERLRRLGSAHQSAGEDSDREDSVARARQMTSAIAGGR